MKISIKQLLLLFFMLLSGISNAQNKFDTPYGDNEAVGKSVEINGAKIYFEEDSLIIDLV